MAYIKAMKDGENAAFERLMLKSRKEWLQRRSLSLGGSDAATTLGLNPWKTTDRLFDEKTGLVSPDDISNKEAVQYGIKAEKPLADLFVLDFQDYKVYRRANMLLINKALPYMTYSPDGELVDKNGRKGLLEIKTTTINQSMHEEKWRDKVPDNYYCQILHGLLVTGYEFAILKAQLKAVWPDGFRISTKHYFFERAEHEESMKHLLRAELEFWKHIKARRRPPLLLPQI